MHKKITEEKTDIKEIKIDDSSELSNRDEIVNNPDYYKLLYENCPLPYQTLDEKGRIIDVNRAWIEMLKYNSKEEVINTWFGDYVSEDCRLSFKEKYYNFKKEAQLCCLNLTLIKKDQTKIKITLYGKISSDEEGKFRQTHCLFIHSLKELETKEESAIEHDDLINKWINDVQNQEFDDIYNYVGDKINELSGNATIICSFNNENSTLKIEKISGLGKLYDQLIKVLQKDPTNVTFNVKNEDRSNLLKGKLIQLDKPLLEYLQAYFPKAICLAIEKLFLVNQIYLIGFCFKKFILGCGVIFTTQRKKIKNIQQIESFASFVSVLWNRN